MTIALRVPADQIPQPSAFDTFGHTLTDWFYGKWILLVPLLTGLGLTFAYLIRPRTKLGPVGVRFEPPTGVGPAFCGVLIDDRVDSRDITAGLVSLAVKGHIKFVSEHQHGRFEPDSTYIKSTGKKDKEKTSPNSNQASSKNSILPLRS